MAVDNFHACGGTHYWFRILDVCVGTSDHGNTFLGMLGPIPRDVQRQQLDGEYAYPESHASSAHHDRMGLCCGFYMAGVRLQSIKDHNPQAFPKIFRSCCLSVPRL